ncbi:sialidase family protein [Pontibacter burrus]|uniref:Exo-alpha-sialidase n=1 Tax=Pontibacter burrus TaxID=2704466 RepID=A0A6B3LVQ4_9BACT|nr:sialidase family protein [Pontibacter burrus]NEM97670.1 exo-alpha-sialidase [Pontibacter burrus]
MTRSFNILYTLFLALFLVIASCSQNRQPANQADFAQVPASPVSISTPGLSASCPYLTQDNNGNVVLSWVQAIDTTENYLMAYAVSDDGGKTFGEMQTIATTKGVHPHDENLPRILYRSNGDIIAMYPVSNPNPKNSYAGLVFYTQSFDGGKTWTEARQLSEDTVNSIDERYFDMEELPNGEVGAIWLDSRKETDKEGSSLYFASTNGRNGFTNEKVIDTQLCQCCRTDLYVDNEQQLHVAYRGILNDSIRDMMHLVSLDGGKTFSGPERISADNWVIDGCPHTGPAMTSNKFGMHYAWFTMGGGSGVYYSQKEPGKTFTPRETISNAPAARHPQLSTFNNGKLAIVWDERGGSDKKSNYIGLQIRSENGAHLRTAQLTAANGNAVYPVITTIKDKELLVAYTVKKDNGNEVWWQLVKPEI